uniref:Potassium/proton antiporter CemA n=1 Tax=Gloeotilopsis sterilis TaxID=160069 RepID=A0A097KNG6_GLOST|nr:chloroplast enveloppe membrane protein [Gloeotilopsis sterilis]AIT94744.1 chloroplast enveloppe membrane protein [Gloeotilopsis sterilis]
MEKQAFEQTGLIPRSIIRTFDRFKKQIFPGGEFLVLQEFRISRYQVLVSVKCLLSLIFIPLLFNFFVKFFILLPLTNCFWNTYQNKIFLNSYQQERAFKEIKFFEEKIYFESLLEDELKIFKNENLSSNSITENKKCLNDSNLIELKNSCALLKEEKESKFQKKFISLANQYNNESIESLTNFFIDFLTLGTLALLFVLMKAQIIILKSFLTESIYSLSDTTKSFLLILFTDLLVGFHSPKGWEFFLELILLHFGLPKNQEFIFLFVATFPVLLDTVFKYWIFRYLNKISPSTVATYHNMIE